MAIRSGSSTITAKAKNNIASSITIKVYSKVTGLTLKENELTLQEGEEYKIEAVVFPDDATNSKVNYTTSNANIATIDTNGNIKAISEGTCNIKVKTQEGDYEQELMLTVIQKLPEGAIAFEEELKVVGNQITGINEKTTVEMLLTKITSIYKIQIENSNGEVLENKNFVGTGSKLKIIDDTGKTLIQYNIILYGDVNGDGKINSIDLLVLQRHILEIKPLTGIFFKAGNIDKTGKRPSSVDLLKMQRHILEIEAIKQ